MNVDSERYAKLNEAFARARALAPEEREGVRTELARTDPELARELDSLLATLEGSTQSGPARYLGEQAIGEARAKLEWALSPTGLPGWTPERIAGFRVLRRIGEGGMGVVFEAEQDTPRRRVALKMIHPTLDSHERVRRFKLEAEVLARLQHPGIARIYECGANDLGRGPQPYFAMELIEGVDLRAFVRSGRLATQATLALVAEVADAVQHAHERGVVHRDLKPDNVLVDAQGRPKVLDFGVARASDTSTLLSTLVTQTGELVGTLAYMAPEQLSGGRASASAAVDVYALGVILYELLSGALPHEIVGLPITTALELLSKREPRPLCELDGSLRGDVETIVAKAMEKDPSRRYTSAAALAADLRRHLANLPIAARAPSVAYRVAKLLRRNRSLTLSIGSAIALLVAGLVATAWQARVAQHERDRARDSADEQRRLSQSERAARREADLRSREARESEALALRYGYSASMLSVFEALDRGQFPRVVESLDATPEALRGWEWRLARARLDARLETHQPAAPRAAAGDDEHVAALLASRRGSWYLSIDARVDQGVFQHDSGTGALIQRWGPPAMNALLAQPVLSLDDERLTVLFTTQDSDDRAQLETWEVASGRRLGAATLPLKSRWSTTLSARPNAIRRDGGAVLLGSAEGLALWDVARESVVAQSTVAVGYDALAFSLDGRLIALCGATQDAQLLDAATLEVLETFRGHDNSVTCLAFSPDSTRLATGGMDRRALVWDLTQRPATLASIVELPERPIALEFAPDGEHVAAITAPALPSICVARAADGRLCSLLHTEQPELRNLVFLDTRTVATLGLAGELSTWSADARELVRLRGHASFVYGVASLPELGLIASVGWDGWRGSAGALRLWDVDSGAQVVQCLGADVIALNAKAAPDSSKLAVLLAPNAYRPGAQREIVVLDTESGAVARLAVAGYTTQFTLDPRGERLVLFESDATGSELIEHDTATMKRLRRARLPTRGQATCIEFARDGRWLAVGVGPHGERATPNECGALILDARSWEALRQFGRGAVTALALTPDGRRIALASSAEPGVGALGVWNVDDGRCIARRERIDVMGSAVTFSPDGARIATGHSGAFVNIWDAATLDPLARLEGHKDYVMALAWSERGGQLVSASGDGSLQLWSPRPARERIAAQRARAAALPRVEALVQQLLAPDGDTVRARARIEQDASLGELERTLARQVVLREALARTLGQ